MSDQAKPTLNYYSPPPRRAPWFWAWVVGKVKAVWPWFLRRPLWVIAIVVTLPMFVFEFSGVAEPLIGRLPWGLRSIVEQLPTWIAFFIPGALQRKNWRQLVAALAMGVAWSSVNYGLSKVSASDWYPWNMLVWTAPPLLAVGVMEWVLVRPRKKATLVWTGVLALAGACVIAVVDAMGRADLPDVFRRSVFGDAQWISLIHVPLRAIVAWMAITQPRRLDFREHVPCT